MSLWIVCGCPSWAETCRSWSSRCRHRHFCWACLSLWCSVLYMAILITLPCITCAACQRDLHLNCSPAVEARGPHAMLQCAVTAYRGSHSDTAQSVRHQCPGGAAQAWCVPLPMPCLLSGPLLPSTFRIATGHAAVSAAHTAVGPQPHLEGHNHACESDGHGALGKGCGGDRFWCMLSFPCLKVSDGVEHGQCGGGVPLGCSAHEGYGAGGQGADWGATCVSRWCLVMPEVRFRTLYQTANSQTALNRPVWCGLKPI